MSGMHAAEMWPRFEDGAPVDIGSEALLPGGTSGCRVFRVTVDENGWSAYGFGGRTAVGGPLTRVKRPPVLGKDCRRILVGEVVWGEDGLNWLVTGFRWDKGRHIVEATARGEVRQLRPEWLTHERPDSWERLEEDVERWVDSGAVRPYCVSYALCDIVRRAKALAGMDDDE